MLQKLFIDGNWVAGGPELVVLNKYDGQKIGAVATARKEDVDAAVASARLAAQELADMPIYKRADILFRVSELIKQNHERLAKIIAAESGKALKFARVEVDRAITTFFLSAEEARQIKGETVPLDAVPAGEGTFGFWQRRPVGVVLAITPFNFPLNLVAHKVGPAIAAGNAVILKPAELTPLTAGVLVELLHTAGLPKGGINLLNGRGEDIGDWLTTHKGIDKISFTGSPQIGRHILAVAGIKRVTLELGSTSPVIITPDADIDTAVKKCVLGAFYNSGQVCVSVQRIYVDRSILNEFAEKFMEQTKKLTVGDPLDEKVDVGPMITCQEAERIESWVESARAEGAKILLGGHREGSVYWPTVLTDVHAEANVLKKEAFAPIVSIIPYDDFSDALQLVDDSDFGLQASVFTKNMDNVFLAIKRLNFGSVLFNETPNFRPDNMPYGGNKNSGIGREGVRYAIEEMTNMQMIVFRK